MARIEILAPVGSEEMLRAAVFSGADAVYLGFSGFNARTGAGNFDADSLQEAVRFCHARGVAVHVALNTTVYGTELSALEQAIRAVAASGADAVICQDLAVATLIGKIAPQLPRHGSTQMSVHTLQGALELKELGFTRVVLARELSLPEVEHITKHCGIETECFIHGALCMSVSGQCYMSAFLGGRSGNRGSCAGPCRLPFEANALPEGKPGRLHHLSLKDNSAIDKLDKIGLDNVNAELREKGIGDEAIAKLQPIILLSGTNEEKLATLKEVLAASETGLKGVAETEFILTTLKALGLKNEIELDLTLARGLNYYTGAIFEVKALDVQIGSITGGGRYDNLTGVFGMAGVSGVGISFGADRIFDVLNQLDLYPKEAVNGTQLLFINFGEKEAAFSMQVLAQVRAAGIRAEIFPDASKMKKQMSYANAKGIPFVALVGENEMNEGKVTLKNMESGEQCLLTPAELVAAIRK